MYDLLLTTGDQAICDAFSAVPWGTLGFRPPRMAATVEAAVESLRTQYADAIAIGLPQAEDDALMRRLMEEHPDLPVMAVSDDPAQVEKYALELRRVLSHMNEDMSNTAFSAGQQLQLLRHEFFRALMDRRIPDEETVCRLLRLMRSKMEPHRPCVAAELTMPEDSDFLRGRWHYGPARLELALRNIFGVEVQGLRILSCVLPGERIVLLGCPMRFQDSPAQGDMIDLITRHVGDCIDHVEEFMGLDLFISSIRVLPALTAMAKDA